MMHGGVGIVGSNKFIWIKLDRGLYFLLRVVFWDGILSNITPLMTIL